MRGERTIRVTVPLKHETHTFTLSYDEAKQLKVLLENLLGPDQSPPMSGMGSTPPSPWGSGSGYMSGQSWSMSQGISGAKMVDPPEKKP